MWFRGEKIHFWIFLTCASPLPQYKILQIPLTTDFQLCLQIFNKFSSTVMFLILLIQLSRHYCYDSKGKKVHLCLLHFLLLCIALQLKEMVLALLHESDLILSNEYVEQIVDKVHATRTCRLNFMLIILSIYSKFLVISTDIQWGRLKWWWKDWPRRVERICIQESIPDKEHDSSIFEVGTRVQCILIIGLKIRPPVSYSI